MTKSATSRITILEPDEEELRNALADRDLSPGLIDFLNNLLKSKKWTRKIIIPSDRDDLAAVHVFTTGLKEGGLEIFSELHVYFAGKIMVEKWQIVGEREPKSILPGETFRAITVDKVRVEDGRVELVFKLPTTGSQSCTLIEHFDFSVEEPQVRIVPHPFLHRT